MGAPALVLLTILASDLAPGSPAPGVTRGPQGSGVPNVLAAPPPPERGPIPVVAALVPGVLLHGSGHFAAGERATAWRLLRAEAFGFGLMLTGVGALALTGASERIVEPIIWTTAAGSGLFATSWLADLYGVMAPAGGTGAPLRVVPTVEARLGTRYVGDPTLAGRALLGPAFDVWLGRLRLSPAAWFAVDGGSNSRFEAAATFRFVGPRAGGAAVPSTDGSFFDLVAGGIHHRYNEDLTGPLRAAFDMTTFDLRAEGRYDLRRFAPSLVGSFVEAAAGLGMGAYHYPGASTTEANTLLLARFGFGVYLGRRADRWGEARVYYDHRHDDFSGGLKVPGLGSGPLGRFGLDARGFFTKHWGAGAEVQAGAAWVAGLSVIYRYGRVEL